MSQAPRDNNYVPTILGVLDSDGETPTPIKINPSTHILDVDNDITGSDNSGDNAYRDDNSVTTLLAISDSDGDTPVPLYVDSSGNLLIKST